MLTTKKELMAADEPTWEEKLAGCWNIPHGANPNQCGIGTVAIVDALVGADDWIPNPKRPRHNRYSNNRAVSIPYECKRGRFAGCVPLVFAGKFPPAIALRLCCRVHL